MASSIQEGEYFNPHEVENDVFTYDSLALEQKTLHYSKESIDTVAFSNDSQEDDVGSHLSLRIYPYDFHHGNPQNDNIPIDTLRINTYFPDVLQTQLKKPRLRDNSSKEWAKENFDFEDNLERTRDDPYSRNFGIYKEEFENKIKHLENKYKLKAVRKKYTLEEVWEKCEKFHDSTKLWYDKGFEEE
ncbi:hypothetical protein Tco_0831563 [Tanacetum coccineum]